MISLALVFLTVFGYSQIECDICSWPYTAGVNSQGKCYLSYQGLQSGLQSGCYVYCDAWARSNSVQQPATPMLSFSEGAGGVSCQCQRLNTWSGVEYRTRPTGACDWGYSDQVQSYYDSVAVNWRSSQNDTAIRSVTKASSSIAAIQAEIRSYASMGWSYGGCTGASQLGQGGSGDVMYMYNMAYEYPSSYHQIGLPAGMSCYDVTGGAFNSSNTAIAQVLNNQLSHDTAMENLKKGIDQVQKSVSSGQSSILDALAKLQEKPTGGGGSDNPTDLSGVMAAIGESKEANLAATRQLGDSIGSLKGEFAGRMAALTKSVDTMSIKITSVVDNLNGLGTGIAGLNTTMKEVKGEVVNVGDSVGSLKEYYRYMLDSMAVGNRNGRNQLDTLSSMGAKIKSVGDSIYRVRNQIRLMDSSSAYRWKKDRDLDSTAYENIMDSLRGGSGGSRYDAESKISELRSLAGEGEGYSNNAFSDLRRVQNLSGCSDVPILAADLGGIGLGVITIDLGHYSYVVALSRFMFRFMGSFAAMILVISALRVLSLPSSSDGR